MRGLPGLLSIPFSLAKGRSGHRPPCQVPAQLQGSKRTSQPLAFRGAPSLRQGLTAHPSQPSQESTRAGWRGRVPHAIRWPQVPRLPGLRRLSPAQDPASYAHCQAVAQTPEEGSGLWKLKEDARRSGDSGHAIFGGGSSPATRFHRPSFRAGHTNKAQCPQRHQWAHSHEQRCMTLSPYLNQGVSDLGHELKA